MRINVLEYGAIGDGIYDNYKAFQAALDSGADEIVIPQGIYCISQTLKVHSNICIVADKTAKIMLKSRNRLKRNDFLLSNADTIDGNENIKIIGGIWDGNNMLQEHEKPDLFDKDGYSGVILNFVNVKKLVLKDMVLANSVTFYVRMCRVHHFEIENIDFISDRFGKNQDGLHFGGDVRHGVVKNIRALNYGQTNDDMIALNADDSIERVENLDLCRDTIEDITFENIFAQNCYTIIRMLSVTAAIKNIRMKNIYGGFRCNAINADAARYCRTPLFLEEDFPDGVGQISDIRIEHFVCYPVFELDEDFGGTKSVPKTALQFESQMDDFRITDFEYLTEHPEKCPALSCKNLTAQKICADDEEYCLYDKNEKLILNKFKSLSLNLEK
ncbi:MAG: hypothetical protein E7397_08625 [Ruminococcaceae bacterium]|nr:hypothetical protein [Oscillospiraceae bacterium]